MTRQQIVRCGFILLILAQTALCLSWAADNFGVVPAYGDSSDYIERAKILAVHKLRPFTLPLVLHLCMEASKSNAMYFLFLVQTGLALTTLWLLLGILASGRHGVDKLLLFLAVGTNPLLTHFNFAVMPDSLAMSFSILAAVALWNSVSRETWYWPWPALFIVTFTLAVNARAERLISLSLGLMAGLLLLIALRRLPRIRMTRIVCCFLLAFCCHFGMGKILPKSDIIFNGGDYNFTVYQQLCWQTVFTRAEHLWPLFSKEVRAALPLEEARTWDKRLSYFYTVRKHLDPLGDSAYKDIFFILLKHDWPHLLYSIGAGAAHYTLTAVYPYFYFTGINFDQQSEAWNGFTIFYMTQNWTYTRMAGHSPGLTWWYWLTASTLVLAALGRGIILLVRRELPIGGSAQIFFGCAMLVMVLFFVAFPVFVHIRYALTWHVFALAALFGLVLPVLAFDRPASGKPT